MAVVKGEIFNVIRLFRKSFAKYKFQIVLLGFLSFVGSILEGVGISTIIPLFSFITNQRGGGDDIISRTIEKFFLFFNIQYGLKSLLIFILVLFFLKAISTFLIRYIGACIRSEYERETRSELFSLTMGASWLYLSTQKVGYLDQVLVTDVQASSSVLTEISDTLPTVTNFVIYTLIALSISPVVTILALILGLIIFLIFKPWFYKNRVASQEVEGLYKKLSHHVNECLIGMKTIKAGGVENFVKEKAGLFFERVKMGIIRIHVLSAATNSLLQPIGVLFIVCIFAFFYKTTAFNFASFAVVVYAINKLFSYVQLGQSQLHAFSTLFPYLASISAFKEQAVTSREEDSGDQPFVYEKFLEFEKVSFFYQAKQKIIRDLSFKIKKGEMVGIIGPSGTGKTTTVDLLLRLLRPQQGEILLDGQNISKIRLNEWHQNIGYVSQDVFLINDSIENNIRFYNEYLFKDDIERAAKMANIHEFICSLPEKYKTIVGERGVSLSVGQRQRIALARVLAKKPEILILDEATSALDSESEKLVQDAIERLHGKVTIVIIAHRLSTILRSDRLLVLEQGELVESGSPSELLKDKETYFFKMYNISN